jgi:hypothetical protein
MTKPSPREIIEDFAKEIRERRLKTAKPSKEVINFRDDVSAGHEREVWRVPIQILRYRKDNGRIASDVLDYERNVGVLDEKDDQAQALIRQFLEEKDPERTAVLTKSVLHAGQQEPAIITCDGFLINGNRRKMVMEKLLKGDPNNEKFAYMKVVILPDRNEEGGPPTLLEIEKIENRYQLQSDGKSEYYGFDRALSIKRKIDLGFSLEEQLRDDPRFAGATKAQIDKAVADYTKNYLDPIACVDRYLKQFRRDGLYRSISTGMSDPEGRWQAFIDYSNTYNRCFSNPKRLLECGIEEDEIGAIEEAAFNIIRLRVVPDMDKVHVIMRKLPKYCRTKEGKKAIKKIAEEVEPVLGRGECVGPKGQQLTLSEMDAKWAAKHQRVITWQLKKAAQSHETLREKETPIELLEAALKKLNHEDMDLTSIVIGDFAKARQLAGNIKNRANDLENQIYHYEKNLKKLTEKRA